jgi:cohesin loading factor subunit SCC2
MDNHRWTPQNQHFYHGTPEHPQQSIQYGAATADSVHNAQGLLAVYPMASATPTNHGIAKKIIFIYSPRLTVS